jgi:hypothetical protein
MINLSTSQNINTFLIYPETGSSFVSSSGFQLELTHDYNQVSSSVEITPISRPNRLTNQIVFQVSGSLLPIYSGQYTATLKEGTRIRPQWGTTNVKFGELHIRWSQNIISGSVALSTERAYIDGSDTTTFITYTSPNENGAYITYNN